MVKEKNKFLKYIDNFYNSLTKTQKIIVSLIILIILMIAVKFLSTLSFKETIIDYKNENAYTLIENKEKLKDRDIYITLESIVENFLNTNIGKYKLNNKTIKLKDYYENVLFEEFKYNRSFNNFKKISNRFYKKIFVDEKYNEIPLDDIISNVYVYSKERAMYIVEVNTNTQEKGYIGIKIDDTFNIYYIFFIE